LLAPSRRRRYERPAFGLYSAAVRAARRPVFYLAPPGGFGVADTLDGRFDLVALHVALLIRQLQAHAEPGPSLAQALFDAMFADMDRTLRELGVGDLSVAKKVRVMWEALHGRAVAYGSALEEGDAPALAAALARNVWRGAPPTPDEPARLAAYVQDAERALASQDLSLALPGFPQLEMPAAP
jgi:cytochrome b pre-mRNA-processing protein 3